MEKIKKYFGFINITYKQIIALAIVIGVYTGVVCQIPILKDTSFRDIGIYPECWLLFAIFIVTNSKNMWDAALKCFLFFLISQPLVYLVESIIDGFDFGYFRYYKKWFIITLLTFPGAIIAYQLKRKDWLSVFVMAFGSGLLIYQAVDYLQSLFNHFPNHLLSFIFCLISAILLVFIFFEDKLKRTVLLLFMTISFIILVLIKGVNIKYQSQIIDLPSGNWQIMENCDDIALTKIEDGKLIVTGEDEGVGFITLKNENSEIITYCLTVYGKQIICEELTD